MSETWNYGIVQHPMWLLIAEDEVCAERTPPWGCPSLDDYARRLERSFGALERFPLLHLNFDISAMELDDIACRYPAMMDSIKKLTRSGRISFANATYSQPHFQLLSLESAIRQFEVGLRHIADAVGYRVRCYASQEPGLSPQLPQILRAMGFESAVTPTFPFGLSIVGGQAQHWDNRWEWLAGDDIVDWVGLDGSTIPLWLRTSGWPDEAARANECQHGLLGHTRLRVDMPDMVEVTPEWVEERARVCRFVRLDETLAAMVRSRPPRTVARIDANYAYAEGADAEELSRANVSAEAALLTLEVAQVFLGGDSTFDFADAWKTLLEAQHHDAYWIGAPELRAKSISSLRALTRETEDALCEVVRDCARRLPPAPGGKAPIMVFQPYLRPVPQPVAVDCDLRCSSISDSEGRQAPAQSHVNPDGSRSLVFVPRTPGTGYRTFFPREGDGRRAERERPLGKPVRFSNSFYSAHVVPDGSLARVGLRRSRVIAPEGNVWLYTEGGEDVTAEPRWGRVVRGPVFDFMEAETRLGAVNLTQRLFFYHELPWFRVETALSFDEPTEIGDFFDDRTKLHHAWHVGPDAHVRHAVGGCPAEARPGRSFVVNPWLDVETRRGGFALCMFNAAKCWLDADGWLRCVAAWGHDGDRFHNRQGPLAGIMGPLNWTKPMDLRLRGTYTVSFAGRPHERGAGVGEIAEWAQSLLLPPRAFEARTGEGNLPWSRTFLTSRTPGLLQLSVRSNGADGAVLRMAEGAGATARPGIMTDGEWKVSKLSTLDGAPARSISPHKIARIELSRKRRAEG